MFFARQPLVGDEVGGSVGASVGGLDGLGVGDEVGVAVSKHSQGTGAVGEYVGCETK